MVPVHTQGSLLDDRYRVIRHLGSGGMASVLLCEDERLGRQVAVKRLHADSPVDVEQRFNREAKLGASLNHPNLVSVFDTAHDDEGVLIVMEYVDGEPLSRMLRRGPLRPEEVRRMVVDLGDALDHAHAQGIVHRDVKPANVLIREDGVTKLADLGIATASDGTKITRSGIVLGTASYMAPEQLEGRKVGPAADIYALAAIAFEALSGRKPREGRTPMEIAHKLATEGPPDLRDAWPNAPRQAAEVLKRGMALDPDDRPESAGEFARELAEALKDDPTETAPTRGLFRTRRRRAAAAAGAAGAGAAAAGGAAAAQAAPAGGGAAPGGAGAAPGGAGPAPRDREVAPRPQLAPRAREPVASASGNGHDTPRSAPAPATARRAAARPGRARRGPSLIVPILAVALIALAAAAIAAAVFSGGDDSSSSSSNTPTAPVNKQQPKKKAKPKAKPKAKKKAAEPAAPAAPAPSTGGGSTSYDPARGAQLNSQGFQLMNQGNYDEAVGV